MLKLPQSGTSESQQLMAMEVFLYLESYHPVQHLAEQGCMNSEHLGHVPASSKAAQPASGRIMLQAAAAGATLKEQVPAITQPQLCAETTQPFKPFKGPNITPASAGGLGCFVFRACKPIIFFEKDEGKLGCFMNWCTKTAACGQFAACKSSSPLPFCLA
jgi:hypothetical protein